MGKTNMEVKNDSVDVLFRGLCVSRQHLDSRTVAFQNSERGLMLKAAYCESYDALVYWRKEVADGRL